MARASPSCAMMASRRVCGLVSAASVATTINAVFSPEADPRGITGTGTAAANTFAPQPFNVNTITRGVSTADFYLAVPSAIVQFLETDTETKLIAKPQLRGAEGQKITLNLGDQIPVPSTVFTPLATGVPTPSHSCRLPRRCASRATAWPPLASPSAASRTSRGVRSPSRARWSAGLPTLYRRAAELALTARQAA